jgi:hypothetical protein
MPQSWKSVSLKLMFVVRLQAEVCETGTSFRLKPVLRNVHQFQRD